MSDLPRVTYSNIGTDFSKVHDLLDESLPRFERSVLEKIWATRFATGPVQPIISPIDKGLSLGEFPVSSERDVDAAIAAARAAFPAWAALPMETRLQQASKWRDALARQKFDLAMASLYEVGKSRIEALGEAEETQDLIEYYTSELVRHANYRLEMRKLVPHERSESVLKPFGVFAVIAPFNFPLALSVNMIMGALLTGNAVVYKPSPGCALSGLLLVQAIHEAGIPDGVLNLVLGDGEVGERLVRSPDVDGVAFTGSHATGMSIHRTLAMQRYARPLIADMGGKNPAYVTRNANLHDAAEGVARSAFGLQGQKCSACSVAYVEQDCSEEFLEALAQFASRLIVGDPRRRDVFMGPVYNAIAADRLVGAIEMARKSGRVIQGGTRVKVGVPGGNYFLPAIIQLPEAGPLTQEELFVPLVAIRPVASLADGIREGNATNYGLSAGIYSNDPDEVEAFFDTAQAGVLYANRRSGATTGAWPGGQPFCGWKKSGASGKGGLGPYYLQQFMREQSRTLHQPSPATL